VRPIIGQWCHCAFHEKKPIGVPEAMPGKKGTLVHGVPGVKKEKCTVIFDGDPAPMLLPCEFITSSEAARHVKD
jgi:hypothetical protein